MYAVRVATRYKRPVDVYLFKRCLLAATLTDCAEIMMCTSHSVLKGVSCRKSYIHCVSKKTVHLTFDHNFDKCRPFFNFLLLTDSQVNSV